MKSAQETSSTFSNFSSGLRRAAAGITTAAQLTGASLPSLGVAAVGTAAFTASAQRGDSAVMLAPGTSSNGQAYIDYGAQFANSTVAIKRVSATTGAISYGSGVLVNDSSGIQYVVTAAHVLDSTSGLRPAASLSILAGANYLTPTAASSVLSYSVHSTYTVGSGGGQGTQLDLAFIQLGSSFQGLGISIGTQAVPNGVVLDFAGYGQYGLSQNSLQAKDGFIRAFQSISGDPSGVLDNGIYNASFAFGLPNDQYLGFGAAGDSGGGVYYNGQLQGITVSGTDYATNYLDLTSDAAIGARNQFLASIPEPTTLGLVGLTTVLVAARRRRKNSNPQVD